MTLNRETMSIIWLTLRLGLVSTFLSALIGVPLGLLLKAEIFTERELI